MKQQKMSTEPPDEVTYLPLLCDELTEKLRLKASTELNETEEKIHQGLQILRSLIAKENLQVRSDDSFLSAFLRFRKFRIEKAQEALKRYSVIRSKYIEYFAYYDFSVVKKFYDLKTVGFLPYRDEDGAAILYIRESVLPPERLNVDEAMNFFFPLLHFLLEYPASSISGYNIILDFPMRRFTNYYAYVKLAVIYFSTLASGLPSRMKRLDIVNENRISRIIVNIVWPFIPAKLQRRVHFHGKNMESLVRIYHPSILPEEFGGTLGPIENEFYLNESYNFYQNMRSQNPLFDHGNSISKGRRKSSFGLFRKASQDNASSAFGLFNNKVRKYSTVSASGSKNSFQLSSNEASTYAISSGRLRRSYGLFETKVRDDSKDCVASRRRTSVFGFFINKAYVSTGDIPPVDKKSICKSSHEFSENETQFSNDDVPYDRCKDAIEFSVNGAQESIHDIPSDGPKSSTELSRNESCVPKDNIPPRKYFERYKNESRRAQLCRLCCCFRFFIKDAHGSKDESSTK